MAATVEARRLTEAHRLAQSRLAAQVVAQLLAVFPLLDPQDVNSTVDRWLTATVPIVRVGRSTSARLAATYLTTFRALELGVDAARFVATIADDLPDEQIATSLVVTGPATIRAGLARGRQLRTVLDLARTSSASAGMRHALNGGRDTVVATTDSDPKALGWARATSGKACSFCALLAGRGPVYKGEGTAGFQAHDHCSCSAEPVYRRDAAWPAGADRYAELYAQAKAEGGDAATVRANFRRLVA
jgi:hypothetical protein